jgi:pimeloyl-ACP methyl ester carboxylesterase
MVAIAFLLAICAMNLVAYLHARAFTHFAPPGTPLARPETMTISQKLRAVLTGASQPRPVNDRCPADVGLEFATHFVSVDDLRLETWHIPCAGARSLTLLFHGHGGCKSRLLPEAKAFHDLDSECLLVDFRAVGGSTGEVCTLGVSEADDVVACVALARRLRPEVRIILYGQSMGAAAILRAAGVQKLAADALILECPFDRLITTVEHRFEAMGLPVFPMARLLVFWGGAQHGFNAFDHNPVDYARQVSIPTLHLYGARDPRVKADESEAVAMALAGPKSIQVFAEAGHESYLSRCPDQWREVVGEFLRAFIH